MRLLTAREQVEMLEPWRSAARGPVPWGSPESGDFDHRDDDLMVNDWSPDPTKPEGSAHQTPVWYHVSPNEIPVGTKLTPGGGESPWTQEMNMFQPQRKNWVWMTQNPEQWGKKEWKGEGPAYLHRVQPEGDPRPWNNTGQTGWVAPSATVTHSLGPYDRTKQQWDEGVSRNVYVPKRRRGGGV